jgi:hypothetical protein
MPKLSIVGLLSGESTPFDGQWLVEYDPTRRGVDPHGKPMIAHLITTEDPLLAKEFPTIMDAEECWKQAFGLRKDGRSNRPLTAFIVEIQAFDNRIRRSYGQSVHPAVITFVAEFFYS